MDAIIDFYRRIFTSLFRNKRLLIVAGVFSGIFAGLTLLSGPFLYYFSNLFSVNLSKTSLPITFLLISLAAFAIVYLQSGGADASSSRSERYAEHLLREGEINKRKIIELNESIKYLQQEIALRKKDGELSVEEKENIIREVISKTGEESLKKIFDEKTLELKESLSLQAGVQKIVEASGDIVSRLKREISDLRLRSNINLVLGMLITIIGLYLLWTTVSMIDTSVLLKQLASEGNESNYKFIKNLILPLGPRTLLVVFVEVFAYFFLRLYKDGLSDIKYFQNELTNAESKLAAVEFSYITSCQDSLKEAISCLAKTERNFVLEKGQTTVELERAKSESELTKNIIKTVPELFKHGKK